MSGDYIIRCGSFSCKIIRAVVKEEGGRGRTSGEEGRKGGVGRGRDEGKEGWRGGRLMSSSAIKLSPIYTI